MTTAKTGSVTCRMARTIFPQNSMFGTKLLCNVLSICFSHSIIRPGMKPNTESILKRIALIMTRPRSRPIPNCMNIRATIPAIVVRELEEISGIPFSRARTSASLVFTFPFSSIKR